MNKRLVALIIWLLSCSFSWAKLEITRIEAAHGFFGPPRESLDVCPLDEMLLRYHVTGVKVDDEGKADIETSIHLKEPGGKVVLERKTPVQRQLSLGGNTFSSFVSFHLPDKAPLGEYTLSVQIRDRLASETASFERKITCKAASFQILTPRFFRDAKSEVAAPVGGVVGEPLYYRLKLVGFDTTQKKVRTQLTMHILDLEGKETLPKPALTKAYLDKPEDVGKAIQVNFNGLITLNRAGDYKLKIVVEDSIGKHQAVFEAPLKVTAP